ncbi:MAG: hypothetical protein IK065_00965 [Neisseriaceae bacterium]|nr:hypothetical protein [Neisseriaceae bacterium]
MKLIISQQTINIFRQTIHFPADYTFSGRLYIFSGRLYIFSGRLLI